MKKNQAKWGALILVALMLISGYFILRGQSFAELGTIIASVQYRYIFLGLALMVLFIACEASCTKVVLRKLGHRVPFQQCMGYSFTGFYFSSITPSSTGGQPAQVYYMSRDGIPAAHGTLDMLLITMCYELSILAFAAVALVLQPSLLTRFGVGLGLLLAFGGVTALMLAVGLLFIMFAPNAASRAAHWTLNLLFRLHIVKSKAAAEEKLAHQMEEYRRGAECLKQHPALLPQLMGLSLVQMAALYAVPYVVYLGFGLSGASIVELIGMQALLSLAVGCLPLPGAVGASEGGFVRAFALFFGAGLVTPAMMLSRGISFYAFLFLSGGITLAIHLWGKRNIAPVKSINNAVMKNAA